METVMPATLRDAIATEPMWLQGWLLMLVLANMGAILFILTKKSGHWRPRTESIAIITAFVCAGLFMSWLYGKVGYVRLLGLPHIVFWTPVFVWLLARFHRSEFDAPFKHFLIFYFAINGVSLVIDVIDVARYLLGDATPLHL